MVREVFLIPRLKKNGLPHVPSPAEKFLINCIEESTAT
jgi:hypothetical protein